MKTTSLFSRLPRGRLLMAAALLLLIGPMGTMPAARAADAKASELLGKGVYSEETKGDFDAAIQFYQQVIPVDGNGRTMVPTYIRPGFRRILCRSILRRRSLGCFNETAHTAATSGASVFEDQITVLLRSEVVRDGNGAPAMSAPHPISPFGQPVGSRSKATRP